jgi:hypothetical protein
VPDGLFVTEGGAGPLDFVALPAPTPEEIGRLTERIARRLTGVVERYVADEARSGALMEETVAALREALSAAVRTPRLGLGEEPSAPASPLCARVAGFTLHAGQRVGERDRAGLERLCRYGLRSPFSQERLTRESDGRVVYRLRRPWPRRGGVTQLVLEPHELLRRLAALAPAPYTHLVRYHGAFANRSTVRRRLPSPPVSEGTGAGAAGNATGSPPPPRRGRLPWAQLLRRVFGVDALRCPRCARPMVVLALISDLAVVARILTHLGLPAEPPALAPAGERAGAAADLDEPYLDLEAPVGEVFEEPPEEPPATDAPWGEEGEAPP